MAQTYLLFDFGSDEEAAQKARHTVEGWRQGFRLDKKMLLKFDRGDSDPDSERAADAGKDGDSEKPASSKKPHIRLLMRLDFSDHEKLSYQRWLDRIPGEEHFKGAHPKVIGPDDTEFAATADRFEDLD